MEGMPTEINIISLNCWGLKFISKQRNERMTEIGRRLAIASPVPHIVGLQECWTQEDYQSIREQTRHILPYGKFYYSGCFGGGLAILSKWPFEETSMVGYSLNGRPTAFWRGDWYVGKGIASAKLRIGPGIKDVIEVFNTHLHAPYEVEPHDSYICHRTAQAWEMAKFIRGAAERGHLVLALGDFNMLPVSLAHRLLTTHAPVHDVWRVLHPDSSIGAAIDSVEQERRRPIPTAEFNMIENGATCDSVLNTWRWNKGQQRRLGQGKPKIEVPLDTSDPKAKRLDYIFAGSCSRSNESGAWTVKSVKVGMTERHPLLQCSLSDHFSVEATLVWHSGAKSRSGDGTESAIANNEAFLQSPTTSIANPLSPAPSASWLPITIYDEILSMIHKYTARERKQRRYRMYHLLGSVVVSICCLVATWWSPQNFVGFLLMLLSTLNLSAGVIDGLIGGLFMGSEIRALKEFEWEIKNVKAAAGGSRLGDDTAIKDW